MSKIALIGDTHWGVRNDNASFYNSFEQYYDWLFPKLKELGIDEAIQLGDLFDRRKYINFKTLYEAKRIMFNRMNEQLKGMYILAGNHDCAFRNTNEVNSVGLLLREYDSVMVVENEPETIEVSGLKVDFYPWICPENYDACVSFAKKSKSKIAVGHFEFAGFDMYKGSKSEHGMSPEAFSRYKIVFSGHYHTFSNNGNVVYAGVPYEMTWSDWNDPKGIIILDTKTLEWERLMTPFTKFEKVFYDDKNNKSTDLDKVNLAEKYVKLIVANKSDYYKYDQFVAKLLTKGAEDVKIVEEAINTAIESVDADDLEFDDTPTLMESYVEQLEDLDLDKAKLKSMLRSLYVEASNQ